MIYIFEKMVIVMDKTTLCYIEKDDCYLMLYRNKKEVDINKGKWIGVGGHFEAEETADECLLREVFEETGLILNSFRLRGEIVFYIDDIVETSYLYTSNDFNGILKECDEGILKWIPKREVLDLPLWEADPLFLKKLMADEPFFKMVLTYRNDNLISVKEE